MRMRNGYILLWRCSLESIIWKDAKLWRLWCWLLLNVRWKGGRGLLGRQPVVLEPGELVTSLEALAASTGLSAKEVRSALALGKSIGALTTKGTPWGTRVGVVNWQQYQGAEAAGARGQGKPKAIPVARQGSSQQSYAGPYAGQNQSPAEGIADGTPLLKEEGQAGNHTQEAPQQAKGARAAASPRQNLPAPKPNDACEAFLEAYPKKSWQDAARRWWQANEATLPPLDELLRALAWHKQTDNWKREAGRFVPTASNWLAGGLWREGPPTPSVRTPSPPPVSPRPCSFCGGEGYLRALPKPELGLPKHTATALFRCGLCQQHPDVGMTTVTPQELDRLGYTPEP